MCCIGMILFGGSKALGYLAEVADSDMAMREEDEGNESQLLTNIRVFLKEMKDAGCEFR